VEGDLDISEMVAFEGVFASLEDAEAFAAVTIARELGAWCWPGGADLDSDVLYAAVSGKVRPDLSREQANSSVS
jgi:hypothetical protein